MKRENIKNSAFTKWYSLFLIIIFLILFSGCIKMVEHKQWNTIKVKEQTPVNFRKLPIPDVVIVYTNQEYVCERVRKGDCLSKVIDRVISRYIKEKGYKGTYYFSETLYSVIKKMPKTAFKSENVNLIYPGEVIRFRLPYQIVLFRNFSYYLPSKRVYGLEKLKAIIAFKWTVDYKVDYFDCTERSAFVEHLLENYGFNTDIVGNSTHCWVIVEVEPGRFVHVEAVGSPPYVMANKPYSYRFSSIYGSLQRSATQYDWWNVAKDNNKFIIKFGSSCQ